MCQKEAVGKQQEFLNNKPEGAISSDLKYVRFSRRPPTVPKHYRQRQDSFAKNCGHCGKGRHTRDHCPAKDATCFRCGKRGHYSGMCLLRKSAPDTVQRADDPTISNDEDAEEDNFLGAITTHQTAQWLIEVLYL